MNLNVLFDLVPLSLDRLLTLLLPYLFFFLFSWRSLIKIHYDTSYFLFKKISASYLQHRHKNSNKVVGKSYELKRYSSQPLLFAVLKTKVLDITIIILNKVLYCIHQYGNFICPPSYFQNRGWRGYFIKIKFHTLYKIYNQKKRNVKKVI